MKFNLEKFKDLNSQTAENNSCISIFIPTHRAGNVQKDNLRFKNALSETTDRLLKEAPFKNLSYSENDVREILEPAYQLLDDADFWLHLSDGLAVFIKEGYFETFTVPVRFEKVVFIGKEFLLRPLVPLLEDHRFFVMALSRQEVRFFEGHPYHITPVKISDLISESVFEGAGKASGTLQHHSGGQDTIYHGQGAGKDDKGAALTSFLREIDDGLMEMLHDENAPLVLAAVDSLVPDYQEISNYSNIFPKHISGNPEHDDPVLLHEKAWSLLQPHFDLERIQYLQEFEEKITKGLASDDLHEIIPAATNGKIAVLFYEQGAPLVWGAPVVAEKGFKVTLHSEQQEDSIELINYAVVQTRMNGGEVFLLPTSEPPSGKAKLQAIFRY